MIVPKALDLYLTKYNKIIIFEIEMLDLRVVPKWKKFSSFSSNFFRCRAMCFSQNWLVKVQVNVL